MGFWRRPKTHQERRTSAALLMDDVAHFWGLRPRAGRRGYNLPTTHEEIAVAARDDRNWKRYRRNQYK